MVMVDMIIQKAEIARQLKEIEKIRTPVRSNFELMLRYLVYLFSNYTEYATWTHIQLSLGNI